MTYTELAILSVLLVIVIDRYLLKTRLLEKKAYWTAYAIIVFFQLITNWWLTSRNILSYSEEAIVGWRLGLMYLASAIAYSRVYLGVHYVGDVFFGALLGLGIAW